MCQSEERPNRESLNILCLLEQDKENEVIVFFVSGVGGFVCLLCFVCLFGWLVLVWGFFAYAESINMLGRNNKELLQLDNGCAFCSFLKSRP